MFEADFIKVVGLACAGVTLLFVMVLLLRALVHLDEPDSTEDWMRTPESDKTSASIRDLAESGRKLEAIKRMREESGMGLAESKEAVEAMLEGHDPGVDEDSLDAPGPGPTEVTELNDDDRKIIEDLLAQSRKIEAVKWHRDHTGAGLAEARAEVEQIQRELDEFGSL